MEKRTRIDPSEKHKKDGKNSKRKTQTSNECNTTISGGSSSHAIKILIDLRSDPHTMLRELTNTRCFRPTEETESISNKKEIGLRKNSNIAKRKKKLELEMQRNKKTNHTQKYYSPQSLKKSNLQIRTIIMKH